MTTLVAWNYALRPSTNFSSTQFYTCVCALENSCSFLVYANSALHDHRRGLKRFVRSTKFAFWIHDRVIVSNDDKLVYFETTTFLSAKTWKITHLQKKKLSCFKEINKFHLNGTLRVMSIAPVPAEYRQSTGALLHRYFAGTPPVLRRYYYPVLAQ